MSTADAVSRETAWLVTTGDGLPSLLTANGGSWDVIQAYMARTPPKEKTSIYVLRQHIADEHPMSQRYRPQYHFLLKLRWPVRQTGAPLAETEQQDFDDAIDDLLQRIRGPLGDKTHGGRFLSVAEVPASQPAQVMFEDPEITMGAQKALLASVTYFADDIEANG